MTTLDGAATPRRRRWAALRQIPLTWAVFGASFTLFLWMCAPGVAWMDSGELTAAAYTLGGGHPPGEPGHSLLGKLATLMPLGEIGFRVNLLSAAAMAAALAGTVALARALVGVRPGVDLAATAAAALLAASPLVQTNATRAEVYAPAAALLSWAMVATVRYVRADGGRRDGRMLLAAAALCGAATAFHPLIAIATALPLAFMLAMAAPRRLRRLAGPALAVGLLGLASYVYLVVRANAAEPPLLIWGDPSTWSGLVDVLRAPAYQSNFGLDGAAGRVADLGLLVGDGLGAGILFGGLVGLGFAALTGLRGAGTLLLAALAVLIGASTQATFNPDMPGYVLPALLALSAGPVVLAAALGRALPGEVSGSLRRVAAVAALVPIAAAGMLAPPQPGAAGVRRDQPLALWSDTVEAMPAGPGVYFADGDAALFGAQYERLVAGGRPDLAVVTAEMCRDRWFLSQVKRALPELYVPFIDDGVAGNTADRLAVSNLRAGHAVGGDQAAFGRLEPRLAAPRGRGFRYLLTPPAAPARPQHETPPPADYPGWIGHRIAGRQALERALYEGAQGRLGGAARAAGLGTRFGAADLALLAQTTPVRERPALYAFLPPLTPVFLHEDWQAELLGDDLAWVGGLDPVAAPDSGPAERQLHAAWRGLLAAAPADSADGSAAATTATVARIARFGPSAEHATGRMLAIVGRADLAEPYLRALIARAPDATAQVLLGALLGNRGDLDGARAAWQEALRLEPDRADAASMLRRLDAAATSSQPVAPPVDELPAAP